MPIFPSESSNVLITQYNADIIFQKAATPELQILIRLDDLLQPTALGLDEHRHFWVTTLMKRMAYLFVIYCSGAV